MAANLSIGNVALATGVKVVTIRYYEKVELMPAPRRTPETIVSTANSTSGDCISFADAGTWGSAWSRLRSCCSWPRNEPRPAPRSIK